MAHTGIKITELPQIANIAANSAMPIVELVLDETQQINVAQLGTYILGNIAPTVNSNLGSISNVTILGGAPGFKLTTYGNGSLYWSIDANTGPNGSNTAVQFNNNGVFGGSNAFVFDSLSNLATILNANITNANVSSASVESLEVTNNANISDANIANLVTDNLDIIINANIANANAENIITGNLDVTIFANIADANIANIIAENVDINTFANIADANIANVNIENTTTANIDVTNTANIADANVANLMSANISVTNNANLGQVANINILGGSNGQILSTDGAGNLIWKSDTSFPSAGNGGNASTSLLLLASLNGGNAFSVYI
jgi:hypothetical protein